MLNIHSIFHSFDGEVNAFGQGALTTFVRLSGCNLRCVYCDTKYAQEGQGTPMSIPQVIRAIKKYRGKKVTITGGEPLLQSSLSDLLFELNRDGYRVTIETNGSIPVNSFPLWGAFLVMDWKLPSSGETEKMEGADLALRSALLCDRDFIKFVIKDHQDFLFALEIVDRFLSVPLGGWAFSPCFGDLEPQELIAWMKDAQVQGKLPVNAVFSYQLHKILYPNSTTEV